MIYYPLQDNEHLAFPEELREAVLSERRKSRSKHKAHNEDEYIWAVYWCEYYGPNHDGEAEHGHAFVSLGQFWKYRSQSDWAVAVPGIHSATEPDEDMESGYKYWDTITEFLGSFGLTYDRERFDEYS